MKTIKLFLMGIAFFCIKISAQDPSSNATTKIPSSFKFDYKVVYQINEDNKKSFQTLTYYFTKNGDYMGLLPPKDDKENSHFMVYTKDGKSFIFSEAQTLRDQKEPQKTLMIMDMRNILKGMGNEAKTMPETIKKTESDKNVSKESFKKTGRTKDFFGYTAEEYEIAYTEKDNKGKVHSGMMSIWYAKVDFDPSIMTTFGMGNLSGQESQTKMQQSHQNNMFGIGLTEKNYLLMEYDFTETGNIVQNSMKVVSLDKTSLNQSTSGYKVQNFGDMNLKEMIKKGFEEK